MLIMVSCLITLVRGMTTYLERQNHIKVDGQISELFITSDESSSPVYHLRYTYRVDGVSMNDSEQVNRGLYERSSVGQPISVYYERDNPAVASLRAEGWGVFSIPVIIAGIGGLVLAVLGLFLLRRGL
jgi:hypothetical protein